MLDEEDFKSLVEESAGEGIIGEEEKEMIQKVFELGDVTVSEVMTPRTDVIGIEADLTVEEAADLVASVGRSRYPVYHDSLDNIVGVVHAKQILANLKEARFKKVKDIVANDTLFVPGTREVEDLLSDVSSLPDSVRGAVNNHGGGHLNHTIFWNNMSKSGGGAPSGPLADAINSAFGGFDEFKSKFAAAAASRFGSGWAWLGVKSDGGLGVCSTPNQDNPLRGCADCPCTPILGLDVWEHAYYLNYQNRRPDYISAWWNVVNWKEVEARFDKA